MNERGAIYTPLLSIVYSVTDLVTKVMYDSVNFSLTADVAKADFLAETSQYINVTGEHLFSGVPFISGNIDNSDNSLKVSLSRNRVKISEGSLCKWFLGDNQQTLGRSETKRAIEKISDILHLPISESDVTRLDIAQNYIVKHEPKIYFNHLGNLQHYERFLQSGSLYYQNSIKQLVFYDKIREQKAKHETIPEIYSNRYLLRYEMRFKARLRQQFNQTDVRASLLYNEPFYMGIINRWHSEYKAIQKINEITLNFAAMRTKREFYKAGLLTLIEKSGGELAMINQINEAYQTGKLTKKEAFDLRQAVKDACKAEFATVESDLIQELNEKVKQSVKFYR